MHADDVRDNMPLSPLDRARFAQPTTYYTAYMHLVFLSAVDCGSLDNPVNGDVDVPQTEFPGVATYTCNTGYILSGGNTRTCQTNEMWSGVAPTCRGR